MNYELFGWCCRAGRSTSYIILNQSVYSFTFKQSFLLFYSFTFFTFKQSFLLFYLFTFLLLNKSYLHSKEALFGQ